MLFILLTKSDNQLWNNMNPNFHDFVWPTRPSFANLACFFVIVCLAKNNRWRVYENCSLGIGCWIWWERYLPRYLLVFKNNVEIFCVFVDTWSLKGIKKYFRSSLRYKYHVYSVHFVIQFVQYMELKDILVLFIFVWTKMGPKGINTPIIKKGSIT